MNEIRAFVGHSFSPHDEEIVGKFLKFFRQLSELNLNFSWVTAEHAEPRDLAEKVMSLITGKNLFVGICTRKERVDETGSLKGMILRPGFLTAREKDLKWKASDWVIQEIGLAIGRGLNLILFVENGLRDPGGLQGNKEYIQFDRSTPEKSFGKFVEMINALSRKDSNSSVASPELSSKSAERQETAKPPIGDEWVTPKPEWKRADYGFALFHALLTEDVEGFAAIDQAYLKTEDATLADNGESWEARKEYIRITLAKNGSLENLKALVDEYPRSSGTLAYLARGFEHYEDYAKAASTYEAAVRAATDVMERLRLMGCAAVAHARAGAYGATSATINAMKIEVEECGNEELALLKILKEIADITKDDEISLAIMERIVEIDPSDTGTRFSLAYKHSENGKNDLALFHYLKIPYEDRNPYAWNNIGVAYGQFSLPAKAVIAFRRAEAMGETLAMSNLAGKLISAGFLAEAQNQCDRALAIKNYHKNIGHNLTRLQDLPNEEEKKESEILEKTASKIDFYRLFGRAASRREPSAISGDWKGPDCVLAAQLDGQAFSAVGLYEQQPPSNALRGIAGFGTGNRPVRFRVKYSGTLRGRAIEGQVARTRVDGLPGRTSLLTGSTDDPSKVLMVLGDDGNELHVMESTQWGSPQLYALNKQISDV
jgi:tetratricopeptide (TPR) repeat protein